MRFAISYRLLSDRIFNDQIFILMNVYIFYDVGCREYLYSAQAPHARLVRSADQREAEGRQLSISRYKSTQRPVIVLIRGFYDSVELSLCICAECALGTEDLM